jgi:hypothetical protein
MTMNVLFDAALRRPANPAPQPRASVDCRQKTGEFLRCSDLQVDKDLGVRIREATPAVELRVDCDC